MKAVSNDYKNVIRTIGKEIDAKITYTLNDIQKELGAETLNSITPHYQGNILTSVMKQLDIDSNEDIPVGTILKCDFGVKVNNTYEYISFGNYIVYSSEKQEDTKSYKIICYDKMLYSMKEYNHINITFPITIRDYINRLCQELGLTFANSENTFTNYDRVLTGELYATYDADKEKWFSIDYTYRDIFDELAQATASTICINDDDELEVRYINATNETINEEYLKDINVNFGEATKPINTITFKRSADSDAISVSYPEDLPDDEKNEIVISDNQILNQNDRDDYIDSILDRLYGLTYYLNDYVSTGITFLDLCDRYTISIDGNSYSCIMFNDEIEITQGLAENVHTDMPEETETDYTKTDKTDRRINQTYLIVDKQNQTITSVVSQTSEQNQKIATLTQKVDKLESEISDVADLTTSGESSYASVNLDNVNESEPITIQVHPTIESISYLYPHSSLYPSSSTYLKNRKVRFVNNTTSEVFEYVLPDDLLYYDSEHYDEFILDYNNQSCHITKRCGYDANGDVYVLADETIISYTYPTIELTDGDYTVSIYGYSNGYIFVRLMAKNIYTTQFYTKAETNSLISQTTQNIDLSVNQKLTNYSTTAQMNSAISVKANEINSSVSETYATKDTTNTLSSRISQTAKNITLSVENGDASSGITIGITREDGTTSEATGTIQMNGLVKFTDLSTSGATTINGANIQTGTLSASQITTGTLNGNNVSITHLNASNISAGTLTARAINNSNFKVTAGGSLTAKSGTFGSWTLNGTGITSDNGRIYPDYLGFKSGGTGGWTSQPWWRIGAAASDKRLKKDIQEFDDKYDKFFDELKPVSFKFKKYENDKTHIGFIAQDILENEKNNNLDLDLVYQNETDDYLNLDKREIIALNTWQIQKLKEEIKLLKEEIKELKEMHKNGNL